MSASVPLLRTRRWLFAGLVGATTLAVGLARDANPRIALTDLDLGQPGTLQQQGQGLDERGIDIGFWHRLLAGPRLHHSVTASANMAAIACSAIEYPLAPKPQSTPLAAKET